jgi:hypothetical protein
MTSNEILASARRKILEETTDLVTDTTLLLYMNESYKDLRYRTFTNDQINTATISFTSGVGTLPADFGTLYGPGYKSTTDKTPFEEKTIADFDRENEVEGITIEGNTIKVNPSDTTSLIVKYYPSYAALSTTSDPLLHEFLHELIVYGTLYRTLEDLQDEARAQYYRGIYEEEFKKRTSGISNYEEDNQSGSTMFNYVKLI